MMSLITSDVQTVRAEQARRILTRVQVWPHWEEIGRCARQEYAMSAGQFAERLPEYQRFLALCAVYPDLDLSMTSAAIDQLWHAHILHTRLYEQFCTEIFGHFLHHLPCSSSPWSGIDLAETDDDDGTTCSGTRAGNVRGGARFRHVYRAVFGELPAIWSCRTPARLDVERLVRAALASSDEE